MADCPECARLNQIEAGLTVEFNGNQIPAAVPREDILWMISQLRGWQKFGARAVALGEVMEQIGVPAVVTQTYEALFAPKG